MSGRPPKNENDPAKKRVTFYASRAVCDIIDGVKKEQGSGSVTDVLTQIILAYSNQRILHDIGEEVRNNYAQTTEDTTELRAKVEVLEERLAGLESKYAKMNHHIAELQRVTHKSTSQYR